jgi:hypothetical protein
MKNSTAIPKGYKIELAFAIFGVISFIAVIVAGVLLSAFYLTGALNHEQFPVMYAACNVSRFNASIQNNLPNGIELLSVTLTYANGVRPLTVQSSQAMPRQIFKVYGSVPCSELGRWYSINISYYSFNSENATNPSNLLSRGTTIEGATA